MGKSIATGTDSFRKIREGDFYYIDKSLFIQDFLQDKKEVTLITRPRRFGKTLGMTMLRDFLDINQDSRAIFEGLAIMETEVANCLNSAPVIYLTLKDCRGTSYPSMLGAIASQLFNVYDPFKTIFDQSKVDRNLSAYRRFYQVYEILENESFTEHEIRLLAESLVRLTKSLHAFYQAKPFVLIDEYDQPIMRAHEKGYREPITDFFVAFFGEAFKGNDDVAQGLLTGIQRVAKESIFSQLNNLTVYTILDRKYATSFGLTEGEVTKALSDYEVEPKLEEVKAYYDGYIFGGKHHIFNPWSILSFLSRNVLKSYWINTSTNMLIRQLITEGNLEFREDFDRLLKKGEIEVGINLEASFLELNSSSTLWGLLVNAGYLTVSEDIDDYFKIVRVPNFEVNKEFINIVSHITKFSDLHLHSMFKGLAERDIERFLNSYQKLTDQ